MFNVKISLFARTRDLEHNIDSLHDKIIEMTMVFKEAVDIYLKERRSETYRRTSKKIKIIEHDSDTLRREIESKLYEQNLTTEESYFLAFLDSAGLESPFEAGRISSVKAVFESVLE